MGPWQKNNYIFLLLTPNEVIPKPTSSSRRARSVGIIFILCYVATRPEWIKPTMLGCHPWISNADTTQYIEGFIAEWQSHTYYIVVSKRTYYNKYGLRPSNNDNSGRLGR